MGMSEAPSLEELLSGAPKKKPEGATASGEKGSERKETTAKEEEENVCACIQPFLLRYQSLSAYLLIVSCTTLLELDNAIPLEIRVFLVLVLPYASYSATRYGCNDIFFPTRGSWTMWKRQ